MKGLRFVPQAKRDWKPAPTAWSAQEIAAHLSYWTIYFTKIVMGETLTAPDEAGWRASTKELKDAAQTEQLTERLHQDFVMAVKGLSEKDLAREVELPWGKETVASAIGGNFWHVTYHQGQLNYIQTLLGDREDHF
jgi:uncharacterized damage-inducible protein DinB